MNSYIPKDDVIAGLNFQAYYESRLPSLKTNGDLQASALCPFHDDKTPSLSINLEKGLFYCHSCEVNGSVVDFHTMLYGLEFPAALNDLSPHKKNESSLGVKARKQVVEYYDYCDFDGTILFRVERLHPKGFLMKRSVNGKCAPRRGTRAVSALLPSTRCACSGQAGQLDASSRQCDYRKVACHEQIKNSLIS